MTEQEKERLIKEWTLKTYKWIAKARAFIAQENSLENKLSKKSLEDIDDFKVMMKNRKQAQRLINNKHILTEGYVLLNEIGETLRGKEIKYSITISKTGEALSKGIQATGGVYTWTVSLKEFLNLINYTNTRIVLKDSSTLYKMLEKQINDQTKSPIYEKWTEEKLQSYALFNSQVRNNPNWPNWKNINEGNMLEAFLRFIDDGYIPTRKVNKEYWKALGSTMKRTMSAPDKFFLGGDLNDLQIKGLHASVTNLNTLIQNLTQVLNILSKSEIGYEALEKHYKKEARDEIEKDVLKTQEEITKDLLNFFTSKIQR